ncbi:hydrogenase maturation protease [Geoglobus sp.]
MVVVIGVGNLILGDDGFGIHVIERMKKMEEFRNVKIVDAMTNSAFLLEAMDGEEKAIIVDAMDIGQEGVGVFRFNPNLEDFPSDIMLSMHDLHFKDVIAMARGVYSLPEEIVIVGVKPRKVELSMELSDECRRYIDEVIEIVKRELGL